jgi:hypothetical protein
MSGKDWKNNRSFVNQKRKAIIEGRAYEDPALTASWQDMITYNAVFVKNMKHLLHKRGVPIAEMKRWMTFAGYPGETIPEDNEPAIGPSLQTLCVISRYVGVPLPDLLGRDLTND